MSAVNKVVINNSTVIDLTSDTVQADKLINGFTAHNKAGEQITGSLVVQHYYVGSQKPADSFGNNGDLFLVI